MSAVRVANDIQERVSSHAKSAPEPLLTIRHAAEAMGLKYWLLLRAVNRGDIACYQFGNQRRRVRLSDIEGAIQANRR